jgi:hypothetical protein
MTEREKYTDVLDHPWVNDYRIPVVHNFQSTWYYFVTLSVPEENGYNFVIMPTEEDAILVASYINYRISTFKYYSNYEAKIRSEKLDVDNSINTIHLGNTEKMGWSWCRRTWETGLFPHFDSTIRYATLIELLDSIESDGKGNLTPKWQAWKDQNNLK